MDKRKKLKSIKQLNRKEMIKMKNEDIRKIIGYFEKRKKSLRKTMSKSYNRHLTDFCIEEIMEINEIEKIIESESDNNA